MNYQHYPDTEKAIEEILDFLFSDRKEHILEGGAGTGKTALINHFINEVFQQYRTTAELVGLIPVEEYYLCATTNGATNLLSESVFNKTTVRTVHSLFGVRLKKNLNTGRYDYDTRNTYNIRNALIIIDEASMIDPLLHSIILSNSDGSKILYIGDWKQLLGVKGTLPNYQSISKSYLHEIKRTSSNDLKILYENMRYAVEHNILPKIKLSPGIIDWYSDPDQVLDFIIKNIDQVAIGAYTNETVNAINGHIRDALGYGSLYEVGETVVIGNVGLHSPYRKDEEVIIQNVGSISKYNPDPDNPIYINTTLYAVRNSTNTHRIIKVPTSLGEYQQVLKYLIKQPDKSAYFKASEDLVELRPSYASTCHKLQGTSKNIIMLSLSDIFTCRKFNDILRMLYVGVSRARNRIVFFGSPPERYKDLIEE